MNLLKLYNTNAQYEIEKENFSTKTIVNYVEESDKLHYQQDYVDLGLPSGTLWATKNIGAKSIEDHGLYFQWGDTIGYSASQIGLGGGRSLSI